MIDVGTLVMKVDADTKKFQKGVSVVNKGMKAVGSAVKTAGKVIAVGATVAAGAVTAIGVSSVNASKEFDTAMSKVGAITQATEAEMASLEKTAMDLGASTAFSATEAAEGMKFLGMAGFETNQVIAAMPGLLDLAAASGSELGITADIVSDAMSAMKMEASETSKFADVLAKATTSANVTVETLGESFKYAAPIAGALGFNIEDLSAVLGTMGNKGIKASQAGTTFKTAMTKMVSSAVDGKIAVGEQEVAISNLDGSMRDLDDIVYDLQKGFSALSESEKAVAAEALFGKTAMTGMLAVVDDAEGSFAKLDEAMDNANGTAKTMSAEMLDNIEGNMTLMNSALDGAKIKIGKELTPTIREMIQYVTRNIPKFTDKFVDAFNGITKFIKDRLVPMFDNIMEWWNVNGDSVRAMAVSAFEKIQEVGNNLYKFYETELIPIFDKIKAWWDNNGETVKGIAEDVFNGIKTVGSDLWTFIDTKLLPVLGNVVDTVVQHWPEIKDTISTVYDGVKEVLDPMVELIDVTLTAAIDNFINKVNNELPQTAEVFKTAFGDIAAVIEPVVELIKMVNEGFRQLNEILPEGVYADLGSISTPGGQAKFLTDAFGSIFGNNNDNSSLIDPATYRGTEDPMYGGINVTITGNTIMSEREAGKVMQAGVEELKRYGVKVP